MLKSVRFDVLPVKSILLFIVTEPSVEPETDSMTSSTASRDAVYPDTDFLLKIAERVHAARTSVTKTAENMLGSANHVRIHGFMYLTMLMALFTY